MTLRVGVLGLGSVFWKPYRNLLNKLSEEGRVELVAGFDPDPAKRDALARLTGADAGAADAGSLIARDDIDAVLVLTSMNEHGPLSAQALSAGKHVLVEKPMATSLDEAAKLVALSKESPGRLVCAPHVVLSPTYRDSTGVSRTASWAGSSSREPVTDGRGPGGGNGSTSAAAARSSTSASTT